MDAFDMDFGEFEEFVMPEGDINEQASPNQLDPDSNNFREEQDKQQTKKT